MWEALLKDERFLGIGVRDPDVLLRTQSLLGNRKAWKGTADTGQGSRDRFPGDLAKTGRKVLLIEVSQ